MKNNLESFIKENRKDFDEGGPSTNLWSKIEKELDKKQPKKQVRLSPILSIAASIVVVFGLIWVYNIKSGNKEVDIADINPAYAQKQYHVVNQIEKKLDSLNIYADSDPDLYKQFSSDLLTLDNEYEKLKLSLPTSLNQQFIVKAMVKNREMQLQILNQQLQVINQVNQSNINKENIL